MAKRGKAVPVTCPFCSECFSFEKHLFKHLNDEHGKSDPQSLYDELYVNGVRPKCQCGKCSEPLTWYGWKRGYPAHSKYVRGHNASVYTVFSDPVIARKLTEKRTEGYRTGKYKIWCEGHTKETNASLASASEKKSVTLKRRYASGELVAHTLGRTKHDYEPLLKSSITKKEGYASGRLKPLYKGETKETNPKLYERGRKISERDAPGRRFNAEQLLNVIKEADKRNQFTLLSDPGSYKNKYQKLEFRCNQCGEVSIKRLSVFRGAPRCFTCHPKESIAQIEIRDYVQSLDFTPILSDRSVIAPKELDVYVPERMVAFEFNGLFWHSSEILKDENYHAGKTKACNDVGIRLVSIFEDEWRDRNVQSRCLIRQALNVYDGVDDSSFSTGEIDVAAAQEFFERYHVEGYTNNDFRLGLFKQGRLVASALFKNENVPTIVRSTCDPELCTQNWFRSLRNELPNHQIDVDTRIDSLHLNVGGKQRRIVKRTSWLTDGLKRYDFSLNNDVEHDLMRINGYDVVRIPPPI